MHTAGSLTAGVQGCSMTGECLSTQFAGDLDITVRVCVLVVLLHSPHSE